MTTLAHTPEQLALILRGRRRDRGLTQQTAGSTVGLLPKTIHALESTPHRCSVESLFKLLSALDLEIVVQPRTLRTGSVSGSRSGGRTGSSSRREW